MGARAPQTRAGMHVDLGFQQTPTRARAYNGGVRMNLRYSSKGAYTAKEIMRTFAVPVWLA